MDSIKAIQAQQIYKVQPVSLDENSNNKNNQQQFFNGVNSVTGKNYSPNYPSIENSATLGRSLDLLG